MPRAILLNGIECTVLTSSRPKGDKWENGGHLYMTNASPAGRGMMSCSKCKARFECAIKSNHVAAGE